MWREPQRVAPLPWSVLFQLDLMIKFTYERLGVLHCIIRRRFEQRRRRLAAADVAQTVDSLAHARIATLGHDYGLQLRRIPALGDDLDRLFVSDRARWNRD